MAMIREPSEMKDHWEVVVDQLEEELMAEFEGSEEPRALGDSEQPPIRSVELDAARASARKSRLELEKLWKAVNDVITDRQILADMTLSRAQAEAELEKQRLAKTWDMIQASVDMKTMVSLTRKATGCENERALSVGAARRVFERSASVDKPTAHGNSRQATPTRRPTSQARSARLRWSSREPGAALESDQADKSKQPRQQARRPSGLFPPRPLMFPLTKSQVTAAEMHDGPAPVGGA